MVLTTVSAARPYAGQQRLQVGDGLGELRAPTPFDMAPSRRPELAAADQPVAGPHDRACRARRALRRLARRGVGHHSSLVWWATGAAGPGQSRWPRPRPRSRHPTRGPAGPPRPASTMHRDRRRVPGRRTPNDRMVRSSGTPSSPTAMRLASRPTRGPCGRRRSRTSAARSRRGGRRSAPSPRHASGRPPASTVTAACRPAAPIGGGDRRPTRAPGAAGTAPRPSAAGRPPAARPPRPNRRPGCSPTPAGPATPSTSSTSTPGRRLPDRRGDPRGGHHPDHARCRRARSPAAIGGRLGPRRTTSSREKTTRTGLPYSSASARAAAGAGEATLPPKAPPLPAG